MTDLGDAAAAMYRQADHLFFMAKVAWVTAATLLVLIVGANCVHFLRRPKS